MARLAIGVFIVYGLIVTGMVHASGFGKCPNYPSMPKFNLTKVNPLILMTKFSLIEISHKIQMMATFKVS